MPSTETTLRHFVVAAFGIILALFAAIMVGLVWASLRLASFVALSLCWLAIGGTMILRQRHADRGVFYIGEAWSSQELPQEFRFISPDTTIDQVVERLGLYSRVRGESNMSALEYDLPYGSVLIFPTLPVESSSRVRSVHFYRNRDDIRLFP